MSKTIQKTGTRTNSYFLNIGFENRVTSERIIAIVNPNSAPIKRMMKTAKENNMMIDGTSGKPTRSAIVMNSGHIVLSSVSPKKLGVRMDKNNIY